MTRRFRNRLALSLALCASFGLSGCQFLQDEFFVYDLAPQSVELEAPGEAELGQ